MNENCLKIEPLLAGFALEALNEEERLVVAAHLDTCESCQTILEDYLAVSDGLMGAVPPIQPPKRIRIRLMAAIAPGKTSSGRFSQWLRLSPRLTAAMGSLVVLISLGLNFYMFTNTNHLLADYQALSQQQQAYQTGLVLLTDPNSQVLTLGAQDLVGTLVYDPDGLLAVLNVQGLAELPEDQVYQIWLIESDETRISGGLMNPSDEAGYASYVISSPSTFNSFIGIGVTIEPEGGSASPTGPRVLGVEL